MLTSLVSLQQGHVKKSEKSMKIVNIDEENLQSSENLGNFNEIFRKDVAYDNFKSHRKPGFILSPENTFLEKPQGGGSE